MNGGHAAKQASSYSVREMWLSTCNNVYSSSSLFGLKVDQAMRDTSKTCMLGTPLISAQKKNETSTGSLKMIGQSHCFPRICAHTYHTTIYFWMGWICRFVVLQKPVKPV